MPVLLPFKPAGFAEQDPGVEEERNKAENISEIQLGKCWQGSYLDNLEDKRKHKEAEKGGEEIGSRDKFVNISRFEVILSALFKNAIQRI